MIGVIGDIHGQFHLLDIVIGALKAYPLDAVLLVGDIGIEPNVFGPDGHADSVEQAVNMAKVLGPVFWVPGNHDSPSALRRIDGNIDGRGVEIKGLRIIGVGGSPDSFGWSYERSEEALSRALRFAGKGDIVLSHCPPKGTPIGRAKNGDDCGSLAVRDYAEEQHEGLLVCGHIHEAAGAVQLGQSLCMNVGALGRPYGKAQFGLIGRSPEGVDWAEHHDISGSTPVIQRWERK